MYEVFKTDRLVLRPLEVADAADFARLVNNPSICRMTGTFPSPFPKASVEGKVEIFVACAATGHSYHWAILEDGQFAGVIGVYCKAGGVLDLGYWLGEPFWGRGLGGEVVRGLIEHLSQTTPNLRMTACVFTDNPASAKVLVKSGFRQHEAVCQGYSIARRSHMDNWSFSLNMDEDEAVAAC